MKHCDYNPFDLWHYMVKSVTQNATSKKAKHAYDIWNVKKVHEENNGTSAPPFSKLFYRLVHGFLGITYKKKELKLELKQTFKSPSKVAILFYCCCGWTKIGSINGLHLQTSTFITVYECVWLPWTQHIEKPAQSELKRTFKHQRKLMFFPPCFSAAGFVLLSFPFFSFLLFLPLFLPSFYLLKLEPSKNQKKP